MPVNNAGISGPTTSVEEMDPDQWEAVLAVNLTGTFNATRLSIPCLKQSSAGVILMVSSLGGRFGYPNRGRYATTERGLIGPTETLALELGGAGIRVNAIAPGAVDVDRIHRVLQGRADSSGRSLDDVTADALSIQAIKRFVDPNDIAALALFSLPAMPDRSPGRPHCGTDRDIGRLHHPLRRRSPIQESPEAGMGQQGRRVAGDRGDAGDLLEDGRRPRGHYPPPAPAAGPAASSACPGQCAPAVG